MEWHQPGLWEAFPEEGIVEGREIIHGESYKAASLNNGERFRDSLSVTKYDDVNYFVSVKRASLETEDAWRHLQRAFDDLSLPKPILNPEYEFSARYATTWAKWNQSEVLDQFPMTNQTAGFDIFDHGSLKVAQKIDPHLSIWVRADLENASFRVEHRRWYEDPGFSGENRTETTWTLLIQSFESLGLPEPGLEGPEEIKKVAWKSLDPV